MVVEVVLRCYVELLGREGACSVVGVALVVALSLKLQRGECALNDPRGRGLLWW